MSDRLTQAIKEAYAVAPVDEVTLHTLEIRHPLFIDEASQPTAIRVVKDYQDLTAKLEADAPLDPGGTVTFVAFNFDITLPPEDTKAMQECVVTIDNVSREVVAQLEYAVGSPDVIELTYRPYLSSNPLGGPQMDPPLNVEVISVKPNLFQTTIRCTVGDIVNRSFPGLTYNMNDYPGLMR